MLQKRTHSQIDSHACDGDSQKRQKVAQSYDSTDNNHFYSSDSDSDCASSAVVSTPRVKEYRQRMKLQKANYAKPPII